MYLNRVASKSQKTALSSDTDSRLSVLMLELLFWGAVLLHCLYSVFTYLVVRKRWETELEGNF